MSLNVMLPVFLLIVLGIFLRKIGLLPRSLAEGMNTLCFKCFLPVLLFNNVRKSDFCSHLEWHLIAYAVGTVLVFFLLNLYLVPKLVKDPRQQSVVIQGIYRSNYVILGIPIISNIYKGESIATVTMLVAIVVPLFNLCAVYLFEKINGNNQHNPLKMLGSIAKNPLIVGTVLGIGYTLLDIRFPEFLDSTLDQLSGVVIPLALLILGADLKLNLDRSHLKLLAGTVTGKLFVMPLLFLPPAVLLGFRGQALASLLAMYASPAAVSGYIMAQNAGADHELSGQIIVATSLLSCFTLFVFIAVLRYFTLI